MRGRIISFHSVRPGSGKTTIVANLAALLAVKGQRVVVVETDFHSPSLQLFFKLPDWKISNSLNEYILGQCSIENAIYEVTPATASNSNGQLYLVPAALSLPGEYEKLRTQYNFECLHAALTQIALSFQPDTILLDNLAGIGEESLLSMAASSSLVISLQVDPQDFQDTAVAVEVARKLKVPEIYLLMNNTPASIDITTARQQLEQTYQCKVISILPQSIDIAGLASNGLLILDRPYAAVLTHLQEIITVLAPADLARLEKPVAGA